MMDRKRVVVGVVLMLIIALTATAVIWAATGDQAATKGQASAKSQQVGDGLPIAENCHHQLIMKIPYGDKVHGANGISVSPAADELDPTGFNADSWCLDDSGRFYICDTLEGYKIKKFTRISDSGNAKGEILYRPLLYEMGGYITCDPLGNVYYYYESSDYQFGEVVKFDSNGAICYKLRIGYVYQEPETVEPVPPGPAPLLRLYSGDWPKYPKEDYEPEYKPKGGEWIYPLDRLDWTVTSKDLFSGSGEWKVSLGEPLGTQMTISPNGDLLLKLTGGFAGTTTSEDIVVKITSAGKFGGIVPSYHVDGEGHYYNFKRDWTIRSPKSGPQAFTVLDASGRKIGARALTIPAALLDETPEKKGEVMSIDKSPTFVTAAGECYFMGSFDDVEEKPKTTLKSGVEFSETDAVFIFTRSGKLKFTVRIPRLGGELHDIKPFISPGGNICYLKPTEKHIEVMEFQRGLSVAERTRE